MLFKLTLDTSEIFWKLLIYYYKIIQTDIHAKKNNEFPILETYNSCVNKCFHLKIWLYLKNFYGISENISTSMLACKIEIKKL